MQVSGQHHASVVLPPGKKNANTHRKLGELQRWSGRFGEEKNPMPLRDSNPRRYTDYATAAQYDGLYSGEIERTLVLFSDEDSFHLGGYVSYQKNSFGLHKTPLLTHELPLHDVKCWCVVCYECN
jgi:hypothetical protein